MAAAAAALARASCAAPVGQMARRSSLARAPQPVLSACRHFAKRGAHLGGSHAEGHDREDAETGIGDEATRESPSQQVPLARSELPTTSISHLENLAAQQVDPLKLRWRRSLDGALRSREGFIGPNIVRALIALLQSPIALASPSVVPLVDRAVSSLSMSLDGVDNKNIAKAMLALSRSRMRGTIGVSEDGGGANGGGGNGAADAFDDVLEVLRPKTLPRADARPPSSRSAAAPEVATARGATAAEAMAAAIEVFWYRLLPAVLPPPLGTCLDNGIGEERLEVQVDFLLAVAFALPTLPENKHEQVCTALASTASSALNLSRPLWRREGPHYLTLARLVGAVGLLEAQRPGVLDGTATDGAAPTSVSAKIGRWLDPSLCSLQNMPELLLLSLGVRGLGHGAGRLGCEVETLVGRSTKDVAFTPQALQDICEALLLLRDCGRLTAREPWAAVLVQHAAHRIDRLQRGEKFLLRGLLREMAKIPPAATAVAASGEAGQASSPEAALSFYARTDWFARKSRAQTSWYKSRGAI